MRMTSQISKDRPVHFVAIGGIGMSGIALTLLHRGYKVTGSDLSISSITSRLEDAGATVYHGHRASHVPRGATVVHSSAVGADNPEILQARAWGLPVLRRAEVLAWLMEERDSVAVAGTHGKTTTTSLVTLMLRHAGYDPSAVVGGVVDVLGGNTLCGDGPHFVAEADESDGSLVLFHPRTSIITNIEEEHFGYYRDLQGILDIFGTFIENTLRDGKLIYNLDDLNLPRLVRDFDGEILSYSLFQPADIFADNVILESFGSSFDVHYRGRNLGRMELAIPGLHNVSNSLGALAVALQEGVPFETAAEAVRSYRGVRRRFEVKGRVDDILVVDDYAHHPTEVKATLLSARHIANGGRLVGVFQPHRYTRTKHLHGRFSDAFASADRLILTDIYSANEPAIEGVDGTIILRGVLASGQENVEYFPDWRDIAEILSETVHAGDVVVVMGAGNISTVADELVRKLKERKEQLLVVASDGS